ncbi:hypothetical protein ACNTMW_19015 [Planosporangium sp. 12N6]|uniref:hypothetical protein n=1 Tax=Planosporangium spinosum TaxID=3402278 RepID=UPI003CE6A2CA
MGVYRSQVVAFAQYAAAQVAYHRQILALHEIDGTGCCRQCGRVWPCDHTRHSRQMVGHFGQWAPDDNAEQPTRDPALVRPYTAPAAPGRPGRLTGAGCRPALAAAPGAPRSA